MLHSDGITPSLLLSALNPSGADNNQTFGYTGIAVYARFLYPQT